MTIDLDELERLATEAGAGKWTPTYGVTIEPAMVWHEDGDSVCRCFDNIGHQPDAIDGDDIAEYIAAVSPASILALIAEARALRAQLHDFTTAYGDLNQEVVGLREDAERYAFLKRQARSDLHACVGGTRSNRP